MKGRVCPCRVLCEDELFEAYGVGVRRPTYEVPSSSAVPAILERSAEEVRETYAAMASDRRTADVLEQLRRRERQLTVGGRS